MLEQVMADNGKSVFSGLFDENGDLVCDCVKNSTANINQILTTYTGLTPAYP